MNLQNIFTEHPVCLLAENSEEKVWRILNVSENVLNYLRNWLERDLAAMAINWITVDANTSIFPSEILAERLGLVPIAADPMVMDEFDQEECDEDTCLLFEIDTYNSGPGAMNVLTEDLRWIPLGDQVERFAQPPHAKYPDQIITILRPGDSLKLQAYAVRGSGKDNVKWNSTFTHFRMIPTGVRPFPPARVSIAPELPVNFEEQACVPCNELPPDIANLPGLRCYHLTIELTGGLSFEDIQRQLEQRLDWQDVYSSKPVEYLLPQ